MMFMVLIGNTIHRPPSKKKHNSSLLMKSISPEKKICTADPRSGILVLSPEAIFPWSPVEVFKIGGPFFRTNYRPWSWEAKKMFSQNSPTLPSDICVESKHRFIPNKLLAFHHKKKNKRVKNVLEDRLIDILRIPQKPAVLAPIWQLVFFCVEVYSSTFTLSIAWKSHHIILLIWTKYQRFKRKRLNGLAGPSNMGSENGRRWKVERLSRFFF